MKLYEDYPDSVTVGGKSFALDLDFRNVLRVLDLQRDKEWTELERLKLSVMMLLQNPDDCPETVDEQAVLLAAIFNLFPPGEDEGQKSLDFRQDAGLIRSAFWRIGIDLTRERLHFFRFLELLGDLPEDTALMRTIGIRRKPLPKPNKHNSEEIAALMKAKAKVAIQMDEDERLTRFTRSLKKLKI